MTKKIDPNTPILDETVHPREESARDQHISNTGREILSPLPMSPPLGYKKQDPLAIQIRNMVRSEHMRLAAEEAGADTFEEADDFEVGDDYDPHSPYENDFDPSIAEMTREGQRLLQEKEAAGAAPPKAENPPATKEGASGGAEGGSPEA